MSNECAILLALDHYSIDYNCNLVCYDINSSLSTLFCKPIANNYDFWSNTENASFCNIIADTAINPWILHYFQPKYVSARFQMWSILTVIKAVLNFCSKSRNMQYRNGPQCNTIFSLCNNTFCYNLHEVSARADQLVYSQSSTKGVLVMHIYVI